MPKLLASVTISRLLGSLGRSRAENSRKLGYQKLCFWASRQRGIQRVGGRRAAEVQQHGEDADRPPKSTASVQIARCGVRFLPCNMPKCEGTSSSRPMAYVTRAPVLMHDSVVPIRARNTVTASHEHEPPAGRRAAEEPGADDHHHVADRGAGAGGVVAIV